MIFYFLAQEECRKYHIAFQFDPFSKVAPTIVLSETVSGMFVHPLKALGSSVGEFLSGVNSKNSVTLSLEVFFLDESLQKFCFRCCFLALQIIFPSVYLHHFSDFVIMYHHGMSRS